jgi:hypothetical protein
MKFLNLLLTAMFIGSNAFAAEGSLVECAVSIKDGVEYFQTHLKVENENIQTGSIKLPIDYSGKTKRVFNITSVTGTGAALELSTSIHGIEVTVQGDPSRATMSVRQSIDPALITCGIVK